MKSAKYLGYENTGENNSSDITTRFYNEMMGLFCFDIGSEFVVCRHGLDMVCVRYPLTNTYFIVRYDEDEMCWYIVDGNCRDLVDHTMKFDLSECVQYIHLHKFGNSTPAYLSYAAS